MSKIRDKSPASAGADKPATRDPLDTKAGPAAELTSDQLDAVAAGKGGGGPQDILHLGKPK